MRVYDDAMIEVIAAQTADVWTPLGVMAGLIAMMFTWLKFDLYRLDRRLDRRLERLEDAHSQSREDIAGLKVASQSPLNWGESE